jgi:starvation-inducible outer membrane lipoprotein
MIRFQTQRTKVPTRAAVGRPSRMYMAAFVAAIALIAQILSACSSAPQSVSATSVATQYPDLNDPPPMAEVTAGQVAQIKAELLQVRDNQVRAAIQQQAFR